MSEPHRVTLSRAGIALDVGTTTIAARLVDLNNAAVIDTVCELNEQRLYGADVIRRIGLARKGKTEKLFIKINRQTKRIIEHFKEAWNIEKIEKLTVSGNTVMLHLFLNIDPSGMGEAPFTPVFLEEKMVPGKDLSLPVETVMTLPSISSFVGADITAGLATLDILNKPGPSLLVDIGTNGEMALAHNGAIFCCSAAAGPAFEGAEISCGMGGVEGAICSADLVNNAVSISTIGNVPPRGVCGSGLIDAVALMLKQGIIDGTGCMITDPQHGFSLAPGISLTGKDIRQFQLAKSAILSGIRLLCRKTGLAAADITNVFVAGGFGFFINKNNAVAAGIFPQEFLEVMSACGNVSLLGATQCLTDAGFMDTCKRIITKCSPMDLAADPLFMEEFAQNMLFNED